MKKYLILVLAACAALVSCDNSRKNLLVAPLEGFAEGTYYRIVYLASDTIYMEEQVDSLFSAVEASMSIFDPDSRISRLNNNQTDSLDPYITYCIRQAAEISQLSKGMYDITVLPLVEAWGFATREQQGDPNLDSLVRLVGYEKISIEGGRLVKADPNVRIDLNSIAKGYSADLVGELIESHGIEDYLVEVGGEITAKGLNPKGVPWVVGIDKPIEGNMVPGAQTQILISVTDKGIATSGNYRNFRYDAKGRKIVHTINPLTGQSQENRLLSATVFADNCAKADALGTAMMSMGVERSIELLETDPTIWGYLIYEGLNGGYETYMSPEVKKRIVE